MKMKETAVRPIALALCALVITAQSADAQPTAAEVYAKYPAPVGHRQPSAQDIERARSAATVGPDLNELARQIEGGLRSRLIICRC